MGNLSGKYRDEDLEENKELENEEIISAFLPPSIPLHFSSSQFLQSKRGENFVNNENIIKILSLNTPTSAGAKEISDCFKYRVNGIVKIIEKYEVEIIAFQEPHLNETLLLSSLLPDFDFFGRGRNEDNSSEFQPMFLFYFNYFINL